MTIATTRATRDFVSRAVAAIPPSGIRRFFEIGRAYV